jgi:hypothetical protein
MKTYIDRNGEAIKLRKCRKSRAYCVKAFGQVIIVSNLEEANALFTAALNKVSGGIDAKKNGNLQGQMGTYTSGLRSYL